MLKSTKNLTFKFPLRERLAHTLKSLNQNDTIFYVSYAEKHIFQFSQTSIASPRFCRGIKLNAGEAREDDTSYLLRKN